MVHSFASTIVISLWDHAVDKTSTTDNKVHGKKGKVIFPCRLCEGNHPIHLCPYMDEASKVLVNLIVSQPRHPTGYQKLSLDPLLVDQLIDQSTSLVNPTLSESESHDFIPNQPLVEKMVNSIPPSIYRVYLIECEVHITKVLLVSSDSKELGGNPPIPMVQGGDPLIPIVHGGDHPIPMVQGGSSCVCNERW